MRRRANPEGRCLEVVTLDDVLRDEPQVDAIKIDFESWEVRVIEGALVTIERHRPLIYIEGT